VLSKIHAIQIQSATRTPVMI